MPHYTPDRARFARYFALRKAVGRAGSVPSNKPCQAGIRVDVSGSGECANWGLGMDRAMSYGDA